MLLQCVWSIVSFFVASYAPSDIRDFVTSIESIHRSFRETYTQLAPVTNYQLSALDTHLSQLRMEGAKLKGRTVTVGQMQQELLDLRSKAITLKDLYQNTIVTVRDSLSTTKLALQSVASHFDILLTEPNDKVDWDQENTTTYRHRADVLAFITEARLSLEASRVAVSTAATATHDYIVEVGKTRGKIQVNVETMEQQVTAATTRTPLETFGTIVAYDALLAVTTEGLACAGGFFFLGPFGCASAMTTITSVPSIFAATAVVTYGVVLQNERADHDAGVLPRIIALPLDKALAAHAAQLALVEQQIRVQQGALSVLEHNVGEMGRWTAKTNVFTKKMLSIILDGSVQPTIAELTELTNDLTLLKAMPVLEQRGTFEQPHILSYLCVFLFLTLGFVCLLSGFVLFVHSPLFLSHCFLVHSIY